MNPELLTLILRASHWLPQLGGLSVGVYKSDEVIEVLSSWWGVVLGKVLLTIFPGLVPLPSAAPHPTPPISSSSSLLGPTPGTSHSSSQVCPCLELCGEGLYVCSCPYGKIFLELNLTLH